MKLIYLEICILLLFHALFFNKILFIRRTSSEYQMLSSENELSSVDNTPEHTLVGSVDCVAFGQQQAIQQQHRKLSQQNSLDKILDLNCGGPQTIADLQHKLLQLTSQPIESLNTNTPPLSQPDTPHNYYMVCNC